jgi:hypothetical protein
MEGRKIQGSGVAKTEQREPGQFEKVRIDGMADVNIQIGEPASLAVTTDDNLMEIITTEVDCGTLVIGSKQSHSSKIGVKVTITVPELSGVEINGAGDIKVTGVNAEKFSAIIRGSGDIEVAGTTKELTAEIKGSGDLKLGNLVAGNASVSVAGSGDGTVNVSDQLSVSVAGSGDIRYKGSPKNVQKSIAGSGSVKPVG